MDTLAAIAFGGEPALERVMNERPVSREENIVSKYMASSILTGGIYITIMSIFFLTFAPFRDLFMRDGVANNEVFLAAFFNLFIFLIVFNSFNARTEKLNLLDNITHNIVFVQIIGLIIILQVVMTYVGGSVLRMTPLEPMEWFYIIALALTIIPVDIIRKLVLRGSNKELAHV
jgi:magnesium-transporting ATPase (P-type)